MENQPLAEGGANLQRFVTVARSLGAAAYERALDVLTWPAVELGRYLVSQEFSPTRPADQQHEPPRL